MEEEKTENFETTVLKAIKDNALNLEKFRKELNKRILKDNPEAKEIKKSALSFYIHMDRKMDEALLPYFAEILSLNTKELQTIYQSSLFNKKIKLNIEVPSEQTGGLSNQETSSTEKTDPVEKELQELIQKDIGNLLTKGLEKKMDSFIVNDYLPEQFHLEENKPKKLTELQISLILKTSAYQIRNYKNGTSEIPQKHCELFASLFSIDKDKLMGLHDDSFHLLTNLISFYLQNYEIPDQVSDEEKKRCEKFKTEIEKCIKEEPAQIPELIIHKACYIFKKKYNEFLSFNMGEPNAESAELSRFTILKKLGMAFDQTNDFEENFLKFYSTLSLYQMYQFSQTESDKEKEFIHKFQEQNKEELLSVIPKLIDSLSSTLNDLENKKD